MAIAEDMDPRKQNRKTLATVGPAISPRSDSQHRLNSHLSHLLQLVPESNVEIAPLFEISEQGGLHGAPSKTILS